MKLDMPPGLGRVISRKKIDVSEYHRDGHNAQAAVVVRTESGYAAVLFVEGQPPFVETGRKGPSAAEQHIYGWLDGVLPDFLGGPLKTPRKPKPRKSRAKAKVTITSEAGRTPRHHGHVYYTITAATEGQIRHMARQMMREHMGYGLSFGEIETIDGVLTLKGHRSDNCE